MPTITERFDGRLSAARSSCDLPISDNWQCTLEKFRVPDVPRDTGTAQAWLICESPHTDEVTRAAIEERYPLRGQSGKAVTRALIECECLSEQDGIHGGEGRNYIPVGELVGDNVIDSIKIINVCELPLQSEAYAQRIDQELIDCIPETLPFKEWAQILQALRTVRDLKVGSLVPTDQPLVCDVLEDFRDRVRDGEETGGRRVLLCGKTARACWRLLCLPRERTRFVAHPSRQRWFQNEQTQDGQTNPSVRPCVRRCLRWLLRRDD